MFYNGYFTSWYNWYYGLEPIPFEHATEPSADTVELEVKPESRPNSPISIAQLETEQEATSRPKRHQKFSRP
jgi:hypothetical protein